MGQAEYPGSRFWLTPQRQEVLDHSKAGQRGVKEVFKERDINITVEGKKHLGAVIGSREYLHEYVSEKVSDWVSEVVQLAEFAVTQPQACYAAYTFGLKHRWTYFLRTLLDIQDLPDPLENAISQVLIPAITERKCNQLDRDILALPVRLGGLCLGNPCLEAGVCIISKSDNAPLSTSNLKHIKYQMSLWLSQHSRQSNAEEQRISRTCLRELGRLLCQRPSRHWSWQQRKGHQFG